MRLRAWPLIDGRGACSGHSQSSRQLPGLAAVRIDLYRTGKGLAGSRRPGCKARHRAMRR